MRCYKVKKSLLLGAGFSYDFGMPLASELTDVFLGMFSKGSAKKLVKVLSANNPYGNERPINQRALSEAMEVLLNYKKQNGRNYEELLANIQALGDDYKKTQSDIDSYHYLFGIFYEVIHSILTMYQVESYSLMYEKNKKCYSLFKDILSDEETWLFTLNHDLYAECLAIDLKIPITYGDVKKLEFPLNNLEPNNLITFSYSKRNELSYENSAFFKKKFGINLVKLHGGLSELEYKDRKIICNQNLNKLKSSELLFEFKKVENMAYYHQGKRVPSGRDKVITNADGELDIISKSMLTGGKKYSSTTNPKYGEEKLSIFNKALLDTEELIIIGYGFGDQHINDRLSNAMVLNNKLKLKVIDPSYQSPPNFLRQFDYDSRVRGAISGAAPWFGYFVNQQWDRELMKHLSDSHKLRDQLHKNVRQKVINKFN